MQRGALESRIQQCFAVKPEVNGEQRAFCKLRKTSQFDALSLNEYFYELHLPGILEVARRTYSETVGDIQELTKQLGEQWQV